VDADPHGQDNDADAVADLARQYGHHAGRSWFTSARAADGTVTVCRVPDPAFDSELLVMLGTGVPVTLKDARFTRQELIIAREEAWVLADDLKIDAITIPDDGSGINVFVHASVADAQAVLDRRLPGMATAHDARLGVTV
jgi:hypothetical protein